MWTVLCLLAFAASGRHQAAQAVHIDVDVTRDRHPISSLIYGTNFPDWNTTARGLTLTRLGGNRWTAYNWVNNASNAGSDWHFQNDNLLGGGDIPGGAVKPPITAALEHGASIIVTVPMAGCVSRDKAGDGDVRKTPDHLQRRFARSEPRKAGPFTLTPDPAGAVVYQDEYVHWIEHTFPRASAGPQVFYMLDNEPALWSSTHAEIHPNPVTYREMAEKSTALAAAIKDAAPHALVFGPASYGWGGFTTLQSAADGAGRNFLDYYLESMRSAGQEQGKRLLDVLDIHWYPEARGGGHRITDGGSAPEVQSARVQAPRSLWDPTYTEDSWITKSVTHGPIALIPALQSQITTHYPGTRLSISEYDYGGGNDISGALAEADVLGIFGKQGVFAATLWGDDRHEPFVYAGLALYRNYDGNGARFGDTAVAAGTDSVEQTSAYAGVDTHVPGRLTIVAINKTGAPLEAHMNIASPVAYRSAAIYRIQGSKPAVTGDGTIVIGHGNQVRTILPPMSASLFALQK